MITIPIQTIGGMNARDNKWGQRSRRVKGERQATAWMLARHERPAIPCTVRLTRVAPSNGLDDDNLVSSLKGVRDQIAVWLDVNDRSDAVRYFYAQRRGAQKEWAVTIEWGGPAWGAQLEIQMPRFVPIVPSDESAF